MSTQGREWFRRFEQATPDDQRAMLDAVKAEQSAEVLRRTEYAPDRDAEGSKPTAEEVRDWLTRVRRGEPHEID